MSGDDKYLAAIGDALEQLRELVAGISREMGSNSARLDAIEREQKKLREILTDGNGKAIVPRLALLEAAIHRHEEAICELDTSKASRDIEPQTGELERVETQRAEASKARWKAIKAIAVGFGAAAGAASLLMKALDLIK